MPAPASPENPSPDPRNARSMIALVRIALCRPYTFVVLALLLLIIGPLAALRHCVALALTYHLGKRKGSSAK